MLLSVQKLETHNKDKHLLPRQHKLRLYSSLQHPNIHRPNRARQFLHHTTLSFICVCRKDPNPNPPLWGVFHWIMCEANSSSARRPTTYLCPLTVGPQIKRKSSQNIAVFYLSSIKPHCKPARVSMMENIAPSRALPLWPLWTRPSRTTRTGPFPRSLYPRLS